MKRQKFNKAVPELDADLVKASEFWLPNTLTTPRSGEHTCSLAAILHLAHNQQLLENKIDPSAGFTSEYL